MRRPQNPAIEVLPTPPSSPQPTTRTPSHQSVPYETLLQEARLGTTTARTILSTAHDTHAIATSTAESLHRQTAQLEAIAGHVDHTNHILTGVEHNIEKLTRPFWRRGKGSVVRGERRVFVAELWKRKRPVVAGSGKRADSAGVAVVEEYEEFDEEVRKELRLQDDVIGDAGVVVEELRVLAVGIGEELEKEAEIVDGIDVVEVTSRIREGNRKLRQRLKLK